MAALTRSAIHKARRQPGLSSGFARGSAQWASLQQPAIGHLELVGTALHMDPVPTTGSSMAEHEISIGALARATGSKVETVRYYERMGLMPTPARTAGNYRAY